jgi:hypothetical protein
MILPYGPGRQARIMGLDERLDEPGEETHDEMGNPGSD